MHNVFLIFGYGVPKNIFLDENLTVYLKQVFNRIYDHTVENPSTSEPVIVFSGGKTDLFNPYKRTEADEMIRFFKKLCTRPFVKNITKKWFLISEKKALSTLENFLFSREIVYKKNLLKANIYIFCEQSREQRIKALGKKLLPGFIVKVIPIDFDTSGHRYLDKDFLKKKEETELQHSLWALENPQHVKEHHKIFQKKIELLRNTKPELRQKVLKAWWENNLKKSL